MISPGYLLLCSRCQGLQLIELQGFIENSWFRVEEIISAFASKMRGNSQKVGEGGVVMFLF